MKFNKSIVSVLAKSFQPTQLALKLENSEQTIDLNISRGEGKIRFKTSHNIKIELSREGKSLSTQFFLLSREHLSKVRLTADKIKDYHMEERL